MATDFSFTQFLTLVKPRLSLAHGMFLFGVSKYPFYGWPSHTVIFATGRAVLEIFSLAYLFLSDIFNHYLLMVATVSILFRSGHGL